MDAIVPVVNKLIEAQSYARKDGRAAEVAA
jgi:hypothetical protein